MITSKSPRRVLLTAYHVGKDALPQYWNKYSRRDYTLAQLEYDQDEKLYTVPGQGPDDDAELLDLRGGWLDPDRYLANNYVTGSIYQDPAQKPQEFFQANVEQNPFNADQAIDPTIPSQDKARHGNEVLGTPEEPDPWAENQEHGDVAGSDKVHQFVVFHMKRAFTG